MKLRRRCKHPSRAGWAMVVAVFTAFAAATATSVIVLNSLSAKRLSSVYQRRTEADYLAEGAVEVAKKDVLTALANWSNVPTAGTAEINGVQVGYTVTPTGYDETLADASGIQSSLTGYQIRATARAHGVQVSRNRIINTVSTPIFQFAVFYTNDLEINPGPNMTLGGRVHTNGDMYLGAGNTLTLNTNYVRAVGGIYRSRKDNPSKSTGNVLIREWVVDPFDFTEPQVYHPLYSASQMDGFGLAGTTGYDSNFEKGFDADGDGSYYGAGDFLPWALGALDYWDQPDMYAGGAGRTVMTSEHGMTEAVTPSIGSVSMFEETTGGDFVWHAGQEEYVPTVPGTGTHTQGFFHAQSDLTIIAKDDGSWTAYDDTGFDITSLINDDGDVVRTTTFFDARQGGDIQVIEVDIEQLNASGYFPPNGLVYAASYGIGEGTDMKGVKLVNGAELKDSLTVVSDGGVYVQGDYNTDNKKAAAVIGDAVNLLSNAWDDTKAAGSLPTASDTTFNTAIITGNHDTEVGKYNGGLENLPRFHESWSNKKATIRGSFVNTWQSSHATGKWKYGSDRYKAPKRDWYYETDFNTVGNLPPFTPLAVSAVDVVVW